MKNLIVVLFLMGFVLHLQGQDVKNNLNPTPKQTEKGTTPTKSEEAASVLSDTPVIKTTTTSPKNPDQKIDWKNFTIGVGVGYNYSFDKTYSNALSINDYSLKIQENKPYSFVISSTIGFTRTIKVRDYDHINKKPLSDWYPKPSRWTFLATLNLAELSSNGDLAFNKSISGGLGVGYQLAPSFKIGLVAEISSVRQLRQYVMDDYKDKVIMQNGKVLNALDEKDDNLFYTKTLLGCSLKFIYVFGDPQTKASGDVLPIANSK